MRSASWSGVGNISRFGPFEFRIMSAASGNESNVMNEPINVKTVLLDQEATSISRVVL